MPEITDAPHYGRTFNSRQSSLMPSIVTMIRPRRYAWLTLRLNTSKPIRCRRPTGQVSPTSLSRILYAFTICSGTGADDGGIFRHHAGSLRARRAMVRGTVCQRYDWLQHCLARPDPRKPRSSNAGAHAQTHDSSRAFARRPRGRQRG